MQIRSANLIIRNWCVLCAMMVAPGVLLAESTGALLFDSNSVLELTMPVDFDKLCRPSEDPDCGYTPTEFKFDDSEGNIRTIPISIRRRDGWRALETNCQMPTLFVRFSAEGTEGTPFEGQSELPLTSHCGKGYIRANVRSRRLPDDFESYVVSEYLGYRLNNLITDVSLRVRLVRIKYTNPDNPRADFTHYGFFAEHFESLAERFNAELLPAQSFDPESLDKDAADKMAVFQYMIGNTDWSISDQDNVILLRFPSGKQVPVLFDLDQTGLVNAFYATPAPHLPIKSVKERYYLGFCHQDFDWDTLFAEFNTHRDNVMAMVADTTALGGGDRRVASVYLESFFDILGSGRARQNGIINSCQAWPT